MNNDSLCRGHAQLLGVDDAGCRLGQLWDGLVNEGHDVHLVIGGEALQHGRHIGSSQGSLQAEQHPRKVQRLGLRVGPFSFLITLKVKVNPASDHGRQ